MNPTLWKALHAIWLFTWRPQLVWRRIPGHLLGLLVLPALAYLVVPSTEAWSQRVTHLIEPAQRVGGFGNRLTRNGGSELQLSAEQRRKLLQIFTEESSRLDKAPAQIQPGEEGAEARRAEFKACYERIMNRAESVLEEKQFAEFRKFEQREVARGQERIRPITGRGEPFYTLLLDLYFFVMLPLQCVKAGGGLIRDELQADTLGFLVTRPISRARLLVLKYLAQTAWLEVIMLVEAFLLFSVGWLRELSGLGSLLPLFLAVQALAVPAWTGLGIFLGQVTKRYIPLAMLYGLIVEMGIGRIPTNINTLSLMRHLKSLLGHDPGLQALFSWNTASVPGSVATLLLAATLFVGLAAALFTFREYHHTAEMQK